MFSYGTSVPSTEHTRFCWMRAPSSSCSWWKRTSLVDVAVTSFTGTFTSPKLIDPLHSGLGMAAFSPISRLCGRGPQRTVEQGRVAQAVAQQPFKAADGIEVLRRPRILVGDRREPRQGAADPVGQLDGGRRLDVASRPPP